MTTMISTSPSEPRRRHTLTRPDALPAERRTAEATLRAHGLGPLLARWRTPDAWALHVQVGRSLVILEGPDGDWAGSGPWYHATVYPSGAAGLAPWTRLIRAGDPRELLASLMQERAAVHAGFGHPGQAWRHLKTGGTYRELTRQLARTPLNANDRVAVELDGAAALVTDPASAGELLVVYAREGDPDAVFTRPARQFDDGRFAPVVVHPAPPLPVWNTRTRDTFLDQVHEHLGQLRPADLAGMTARQRGWLARRHRVGDPTPAALHAALQRTQRWMIRVTAQVVQDLDEEARGQPCP